MNQKIHIPVLGNQEISLNDLLLELKSDTGVEFLKKMAIAKLTEAEAQRLGATYTEDEIQEEFDQYRIEKGLEDAKATHLFMEGRGITMDEFEVFIKRRLSLRKLQNILATETTIQETFLNNQARFDRREVAKAVLNSKDQAKELLCQLEESLITFPELVETYSIDEGTKRSSGYLGILSRADIDENLAIKLFSEKQKEFLGPIETPEGIAIFHVLNIYKPNLDEQTRLECIKIILEKHIKELSNQADLTNV